MADIAKATLLTHSGSRAPDAVVGYGPPAALEGKVRRRGTASSKTVKAGRRKTTKVKSFTSEF